MNKFKRFVSLALVLCMVMAFLPVGISAAEDTSYAYNIVHVDAGRKYFSVDSLKAIIDNAAAAGFNQVELYLSDNQGFRFALDDMTLTTDYGTYNLTDCLGDGYADSSKTPDYSGQYLTEDEMDEIIAYANGKGIDIVPCINVPGHMGAILEEFPDFRYSTSASSIDLDNDEAVAFALALTAKYAAYFADQGCKYYNVGADEYANDMSSMGFEGMGSALYTKFVQFLNDAADIVIAEGMVPRAFNDGFYYKDYSISIEPNKAYEVCYWSSGWWGYDVAAASTIAAKGHKMINTNGDYYWILGDSNYKCSAETAAQFDTTVFSGSTVSEPAGSMFCIWCDVGNADGADGGAAVAEDTEDVIAAFGAALPAVESLVSGDITVPENPDPVTLTEGDVSVTVPGLTGLTVKEAEAPEIDGAASVAAYEVALQTAEGTYTGEAEVSVTVPAGWSNVCGGVLASASGAQVLGITGKLENGVFTFTVPHFSTVVVYDVAEAAAVPTEEYVTLEIDGSTSYTIADANYANNWSVEDDSIVSVSVTGKDAVASSIKYTEANATCNNLISNNGTQEDTEYYYTPDNGVNYYPVYASRIRSGSSWYGYTYNYTWYYSTDNGSTFTQIGTQSTSSTSDAANITVYTKSGTEAIPASTTVTITGLKPGSTVVTVGNIQYNVTVNYKKVHVTLVLDGTASYTQNAPIEGEAEFSVAGIATAAISGSTVTFTGVAEGETVATVGNTIYTIKVTKEDLSAVTPLTIEYWITNANLTDPDTDLSYLKINATDAGVNSESGVAFTELVPEVIFATRNREFWQVRLLDVLEENTSFSGTEHQTNGPGDDETMNGDAITYVRYWQGKWQGLAGDQWLDISTTSVSAKYMDSEKNVSYANRTRHQLAAYYMEVVNIQNANGTTELHINASDWGKYGDGTAADDYLDPNAYCSVSVQIVYEDGTTNPSVTVPEGASPGSYNAAALKSKTIVYGYWSEGRGIGTLNFDGLDQFRIYKITAETGTVSASFGNGAWGSVTVNSLTWDGNEKTVWEDTPSQKASISNNARIPDSTDPKDNLMWDEHQEAILIRVYVNALQTEDSLRVHYLDRSANNMEFYDYSIAVPSNTVFNEGFAMGTEKNTLVNNTVVNYYGATQAVSADLATMPQIKAYYRYCTYTLVEAKRSDDGKEVFLYYTFTPVVSFVADFGLPLKITPTDLNQDGYSTAGSDIKAVKVIGTYDNEAGSTASSEYGTLAVDGTTVTYTPDEVLTGVDFFTVYVITQLDDTSTNVTNEESGIAYRVYVFPANTVYYEEGFATYTGDWGSTNMGSKTQATDYRDDVPYGNDAAYNQVGVSDGTEAVSSTGGDKAEFTFTGTGLDIYATCTADTSVVMVFIKNSAGQMVKMLQVDTIAKSGASDSTAGQDVTSYNLPIVSVTDLAYGTYKAELMHTKAATFPDGTANNETLRIDGFRVYNTLGELPADSSYYAANERNATFAEVRDHLLAALNVEANANFNAYVEDLYSQVYSTTGTTVGMLQLSKDPDVQDLLDKGPKNELFLRAGESLTFNLGSGKAQIGLKGLNGAASYTISGVEGTQSVKSTIDMFYHDGLTGTIVIQNTGSTILSITKLKLASGTALQPLTQEDVAYTLSVLGYPGSDPDMVRPGAPVVNPFFDVAEGSWFFDAVMWAVKHGVTNGVNPDQFKPDAACTRAQIVTFMWRSAGSPKVQDVVNPFVDVTEDSWFFDAVMWAVENNITNGVDASHFAPESSCTRAQVVTFLWRANDCEPSDAEIPFGDVAEDEWYTDAIKWAVENEITDGISAEVFGVNNTSTRAQIVTFLYRTYLMK